MTRALASNLCILLFSYSVFAGEKTLVIGDSHSACYNGVSTNYVNELRKCIKESGSEFLSLARSSAAPGHYTGKWPFKNYCRVDNLGQTKSLSGSPNFLQQINSYKPDHVVVTLGDNVLGYSHSNIVSQYKKLIDQIKSSGDRKCTLVTPTLPSNGRTYKKTLAQVNKVIAATIEAAGDRCRVIDSTKLLPAGMAGDGVHLTPSGYNQWGRAVCDNLNQQDAYLAQPLPQTVPVVNADEDVGTNFSDDLSGFFSDPVGTAL